MAARFCNPIKMTDTMKNNLKLEESISKVGNAFAGVLIEITTLS